MDYEIYRSDSGEVVLSRYTGSDESFVVPEDVTAVGDGAFVNNKLIKHVDLRNVRRVGQSAFQDCVRLESVKMSKVTEFGPMAFEFCSSLSDIEIGEITYVGDYAFSHCGRLDFPAFPESITHVGIGAFSHTATRRADLHWLPEMPRLLFQGCTSLEYADFRSAKIIGDDAFGICTSLKYIRYGDIEKIGDRAFYRCGLLEFSSLPGTLQSIGDDAFDRIRDGLVIPPGVSHIGIACMGPDEKSKSFSVYSTYLYELKNYFEDIHLYESDDEKFCRCECYTDVTILDEATGDITGFLPLFTDASGDMKRTIQKAFRPDNTIDYSVLDSDVFDELGWRLTSKDRLTYMRLTNQFGLSEDAASNYVFYLSKHAERISKRAVRDNNVGMLTLLDEHDLITKDFISKILDLSIKLGSSDCTAFLLECKSKLVVEKTQLFDEL